MKTLILASTSPYRKSLLERLSIPFQTMAPLIDEDKEKDPALPPKDLAEKLAYLKAQSLAQKGRIVIGGDQLVHFKGQIIGKSHTPENAFAQLKSMQGQSQELITSICVFNDDLPQIYTEIIHLQMLPLTDEQIKKYIALDQPFDCAGSCKIEKHGIALFEKIECIDFTTIQGLPLMALHRILKKIGVNAFTT